LSKRRLTRKNRGIVIISSVTIFLFTIVAFSSVIKQNNPIKIESQEIGSGGGKQAPKNLEFVALGKINKKTGAVVNDLTIQNSAIATFPLTGKVAYSFTISNNRKGETYEVLLDKHGNELDRKQLVDDELNATKAKYGKLEPALAEKLENAATDERIPIQITLVEPSDDKDIPRLASLTGERLNKMTEQEKSNLEQQEESIMQKRREYFDARSKQLLEPVVAKLTKLGYEFQTEKGAPIIYIDMEPKMIKEVETWPEVARISIRGKSRNALDVSRSTIGANLVEARGVPPLRSIPMAVVEVGGSLPTTPYLMNITQDLTNLCSSIDPHGTAVTGII
jgi:hypothetical protein